MQDDKLTGTLVQKAKELLDEGKVQSVVGWRRGSLKTT